MSFNGGNHSFKKGINEFSDMNLQEFQQTYCGKSRTEPRARYFPLHNETEYAEFSRQSPPANFDWRNQNKVAPVKHQGRCGSCWAFGAAGALEGHHAIKARTNAVSISEQHILDCSNGGSCGGGDAYRTFVNLGQNSAWVVREDCYRYTAQKGTCQRKATNCNVVQVSGGRRLRSEREIMNALYNIGPINVGVAVDDNFQNYESGILEECGDERINHDVFIVGYGEENGKKFWTIKNSWGNWGERGYIRVLRDRGMCKIGGDVFYPTIR
jgi:C1A family cysteine protease